MDEQSPITRLGVKMKKSVIVMLAMFFSAFAQAEDCVNFSGSYFNLGDDSIKRYLIIEQKNCDEMVMYIQFDKYSP